MIQGIANYAQQFGSLLIVLLGIFFFSKRELPVKILVIYGANSFIFQVIGELILYFKVRGIVNLSSNLYTLTEALILLFFFYCLFESARSKRIIQVFAAAYIVLYFVFLVGHWNEFIGSIRTLRDILMVVCSLMYFYSLLMNMPTVNIIKYPLFWINVGMLFFFAGTFTLSLSVDYWIKTLGDDWIWFWIFRNFFRFLFCLVVSYGLWLDLKLARSRFAISN